MVRFLARLLGLVIGVSLAAGVASALAAVSLKRKAPPPPDPGANEIDFVTIMDSARLASTAPAFRGGRVISWYSGVELDLRGASLHPAGAHLEVRTAFGGTRIVVAPGIPVRVSGPAVFGGKMNATDAAEPSREAPGLEITGLTVFGGLLVIASEAGKEVAGWGGPREHDHDEPAPGGDAGLDPA
jgi:hypothetical protein